MLHKTKKVRHLPDFLCFVEQPAHRPATPTIPLHPQGTGGVPPPTPPYLINFQIIIALYHPRSKCGLKVQQMDPRDRLRSFLILKVQRMDPEER